VPADSIASEAGSGTARNSTRTDGAVKHEPCSAEAIEVLAVTSGDSSRNPRKDDEPRSDWSSERRG